MQTNLKMVEKSSIFRGNLLKNNVMTTNNGISALKKKHSSEFLSFEFSAYITDFKSVICKRGLVGL